MDDTDFAHEAWNAEKVEADFAHLKGKTALYVPEVLWAEKRCLVMECTSGVAFGLVVCVMRV
ncbi:hypothetical protein QFC24_001505 [Naganishia onofrii]|uniref:Uncharacterized protein n=1 Tax=Naganishia onofrii TaxID=1851511 RepID=A0ACC2XTG1_9TREE|nr:hypothetical protein QFC24_001505 [Naganishia onofrii]